MNSHILRNFKKLQLKTTNLICKNNTHCFPNHFHLIITIYYEIVYIQIIFLEGQCSHPAFIDFEKSTNIKM